MSIWLDHTHLGFRRSAVSSHDLTPVSNMYHLKLEDHGNNVYLVVALPTEKKDVHTSPFI
jgi:hypothetical protein